MLHEEVEILLVEDTDEDAELTIRALKKKRITNRIFRVRDGSEAVAFLRSQPTSALRMVLLDLKLPKMDGLEVLQRIRCDARTRTLPVVVLSSSRENRDLHRAYELGANSYIVKPVDFAKFVDAVERLGMYWTLLNQRQVRNQSVAPPRAHRLEDRC